ncbi:MAG: phenylalanine--tRNA ligase subunit beta [Lentisphaeria bacterium]|nr:phenylalanine--tRNA ligase subunit beta [Lentisphaeria bacterium]
MKIGYNWLKSYVNIDCDLATLCEKLTMAGIEVESIEQAAGVPDGVVVAKIMERKPHPDSDHMSVCQVFDGSETIQVVCGAPNCDAGKVVPLAKIGTVFNTPEGSFKIKRSKLRGVESCGMMCAADEIGVPGGHEGLLELDETLTLGSPVKDLFPGDATLEVELTPNRPDWLSHTGIARDVACLLKSKLIMPEIKLPAVENPEKHDNLVTVEAPDLCKCYGARIIRNVKIQPSPDWMQERLISAGLRPINNVVDVTNYVMMELGQPLHAFDLDKLEGKRIVVRRATAGEVIQTLDGVDRKLDERALVICDAVKPMAIAGVMGGEDSGVSETTTDLLIESAIFDASNIRATSRRIGLSTDASYRYERGVDFDGCDRAADRCAQLILETAGGYIATDLIKVSGMRPEKPVVKCRFDRIRSLVGAELANAEIVDILERLELKVENVTETECTVTAPLFRLDLVREADLAEEVARINGLDNIPEVPVRSIVVDTIRNDTYYRIQQLREELLRLGLFECMHYSMVKESSALSDPRFTTDDLMKIGNPMSLDLAVLRPSLIGEMLESVERNIARRNLSLRLFEIGRSFCKNASLFPEERQSVAMVLTGSRHPERYSAELKECYDFYDLKGMVESLCEMRRIADWHFENIEDARFAGKKGLALYIDGKLAGALGELAKSYTAKWRTSNAVFYAEIEVANLMDAKLLPEFLIPVSTFPATTRDVAFIKPASLSHAEVVKFVNSIRLKNLEKIELFDLFADDKTLGEGKESAAYRLTFRAADRTLTDDEVNKAYNKLRDRLAADLKVELR